MNIGDAANMSQRKNVNNSAQKKDVEEGAGNSKVREKIASLLVGCPGGFVSASEADPFRSAPIKMAGVGISSSPTHLRGAMDQMNRQTGWS